MNKLANGGRPRHYQKRKKEKGRERLDARKRLIELDTYMKFMAAFLETDAGRLRSEEEGRKEEGMLFIAWTEIIQASNAAFCQVGGREIADKAGTVGWHIHGRMAAKRKKRKEGESKESLSLHGNIKGGVFHSKGGKKKEEGFRI